MISFRAKGWSRSHSTGPSLGLENNWTASLVIPSKKQTCSIGDFCQTLKNKKKKMWNKVEIVMVICQKYKVTSRLGVRIRCQMFIPFWNSVSICVICYECSPRPLFPLKSSQNTSGGTVGTQSGRVKVWVQWRSERRSKCVLNGNPWECLSAVRVPHVEGNNSGRVRQTVEHNSTSNSKHALTAEHLQRQEKLADSFTAVSVQPLKEESQMTTMFSDSFNYGRDRLFFFFFRSFQFKNKVEISRTKLT